MIDDIAEWDAAYVLGALSRDDRHVFEVYLAANPDAPRGSPSWPGCRASSTC